MLSLRQCRHEVTPRFTLIVWREFSPTASHLSMRCYLPASGRGEAGSRPDRHNQLATSARRANQQITVQSRFKKYSAFTLAKITSISAAVSSHRGAARDRHGRGAGRGGRDSVGAQSWSQGGPSGLVSNSQRADERRLFPPSPKLRRTGTNPVEAFGADGSRTAKSCGPDAPTLASSFAETPHARPGATRQYPQGDGGKKARSPGRVRNKPLKPLRGESRSEPVNLW
jgi:hypothetical protein